MYARAYVTAKCEYRIVISSTGGNRTVLIVDVVRFMCRCKRLSGDDDWASMQAVRDSDVAAHAVDMLVHFSLSAN